MTNNETINPAALSKALGAWLGMQIADEKWNIEVWDYDSGIIVLKEDRPSIYKKTVSHEEFYGDAWSAEQEKECQKQQWENMMKGREDDE